TRSGISDQGTLPHWSERPREASQRTAPSSIAMTAGTSPAPPFLIRIAFLLAGKATTARPGASTPHRPFLPCRAVRGRARAGSAGQGALSGGRPVHGQSQVGGEAGDGGVVPEVGEVQAADPRLGQGV